MTAHNRLVEEGINTTAASKDQKNIVYALGISRCYCNNNNENFRHRFVLGFGSSRTIIATLLSRTTKIVILQSGTVPNTKQSNQPTESCHPKSSLVEIGLLARAL